MQRLYLFLAAGFLTVLAGLGVVAGDVAIRLVDAVDGLAAAVERPGPRPFEVRAVRHIAAERPDAGDVAELLQGESAALVYAVPTSATSTAAALQLAAVAAERPAECDDGGGQPVDCELVVLAWPAAQGLPSAVAVGGDVEGLAAFEVLPDPVDVDGERFAVIAYPAEGLREFEADELRLAPRWGF